MSPATRPQPAPDSVIHGMAGTAAVSVAPQAPAWRRRPTLRRRGRGRSGLSSLAAAAVLWGTTGVVVRLVQASTGLSAAAIGCYRLGTSALVLSLVRPATLGRAARALRRRPWPLVISGAGLGVYQALYFLGVQEAGVGIATLVSLGVAPVVTSVVVAVRRRRCPSAGSLGVLVAALAGLVLVSLPALGSGGQGRVALGVLASVGSGLGYAFTVLLNRRVTAAVDPLTLTALTGAIGAAVLLPVALVEGAAVVTGWAAGAGLLYLGAVCTALAYGLFYGGLRTTAGDVAVVVTLLEPLTATLLAVVLLGESMTLPTAVGSLLMLGSIVALSLLSRR